MFKIFIISILFLSSITIANEESEYVFKAKGEFAKELKDLMEKYTKEGKIEIQEAPADSGFSKKTTSIVDAFLNNKETIGDIAYGKRLYETTCIACHGVNASESKYNNARILTTLDKETLLKQLKNYSTDETYGESTKFIMHQATSDMPEYQRVSVAAYIYSIKNTITTPTQNTQSKSTLKNSYLQ